MRVKCLMSLALNSRVWCWCKYKIVWIVSGVKVEEAEKYRGLGKEGRCVWQYQIYGVVSLVGQHGFCPVCHDERVDTIGFQRQLRGRGNVGIVIACNSTFTICSKCLDAA